MARDGAAREQISAGLRYDVLRRCNFTCHYCGTPAALGLKVLHVDHVIPVAFGGTNDPWNLVAACWDCNLGKATTVPSEELIQAVRDDWMCTADVRTGRIGQCQFCRIPVHVDEGDEFFDECTTCNRIRCEASEDGFRNGWSHGEQAAEKRIDEEIVRAVRSGRVTINGGRP